MIEMEQGKIYYIEFGGSSLVGRYKNSDTMNHFFFSHLHYWNGFERYYSQGYCLRGSVIEIRESTDAEKYGLFRNEVAKKDV